MESGVPLSLSRSRSLALSLSWSVRNISSISHAPQNQIVKGKQKNNSNNDNTLLLVLDDLVGACLFSFTFIGHTTLGFGTKPLFHECCR
jgi:hypothetical protein